jgi:lysozyme family protein
MAIDAGFAKQCVKEGLWCGIHPHYVLAVAKLRSAIPEGNGLVGPFRLTQAEWDANSTDEQFAFDFLPEDIVDEEMQCSVFALMAHKAFDAFADANNRDPNVIELYLQQWPTAQSPTLEADLQAALDATATLFEAAMAAVPDAVSSVPGKIPSPGQPTSPAKMGPVLSKLRDANQQRWQNMQITGSQSTLDRVARRLIAANAKAQYEAISAITNVPWYIIAVIHEREASQNFASSIAQGDPWNRVSVHVPKGRGPFASFQDAAVDALMNCAPHAARWTDWTIGGALTLLEQYNGLGYARRNLPSPYIWATTNQYVKGKFTSDHHFDPNAVDSQLGCAAMLARMKVADTSIPI